MTDKCNQCKSLGLPILLARYAVVPSSVAGQLPSWTSGNKVTDIALGSDFKYVLRALRSGFLYLFYGKGPRGHNYWDCYTVYSDGSMILQPDPASAQPAATSTPVCTRNGHSIQGLYFLTIEKPEQCGKVWMAFSEHKWSEKTLKRYADDVKARDARMQTIQPPVMAGGAKHSHGQIADLSAVHSILEFDPQHINAATQALPSGGSSGAISSESGAYSSIQLQKMSTRYPWVIAKTESLPQEVLDKMIARGKAPGRGDGGAKPHVLALWDAVGIVHELNGYRNEAAGRIQQYGQERELQITAMNAIEGVKQALQNRARDQIRNTRDSFVWQWTPEDTKQRLANVIKQSNDPVHIARERDLCRRWELDAAKRADKLLAQSRAQGILFTSSMTDAQWNALQAKIDLKIDEDLKKFQQKDADGTSAADRWKKAEDYKAENAWPKYEKKLNTAGQTAFKQKYDAFLEAANKIIDARAVELIKWLEAPLFIDALEDFDQNNIADGVEFDYVIGESIMGLGATKSGADKLDAWVKDAKASNKSNLLWRAIALNQKDGIAEVDSAMQAALAHTGTSLTEASATAALANLKNMQRLADTYKKAQTVYNTNLKASAAGGSKAFGASLKAVNTRGMDAVVISAGDRVFSALKLNKGGDWLAEKIIQHMFSLRAFVDPADSKALIIAQAKSEGLTRTQILQRVHTAKAFMNVAPAVAGQADDLSRAWSNFKVKHTDGPINIKDARLAVVVMVIEGLNFSKLLAQSKGDARSRAMITASGMSIASALFDIASVPAKSLFGSEAWNYQRLKLMGGVLGGFASGIGAFFDVQDADKEFTKKNITLGVLYSMKALIGGAGAAMTLASTFTYAAPLIQRLTGRVAVGAAARVVGGRAAAMVATRILFMSAGAWITVGVVVIQLLIWAFSDDDLQDWCEACAFGTSKEYKDAEQQFQALEKALLEVM